MKDCKGVLQQLQRCLNNGSIRHAKGLWSRHYKIYPLLFSVSKWEPLDRAPRRERIHFQVTNLRASYHSAGWSGIFFFSSLNEFSKAATSLFNKRHQSLSWEIRSSLAGCDGVPGRARALSVSS